MTSRGGGDKPDAAWTPEQVVDFLLESLARGDFYVLCPDNAVSREMDERRMQWAIDDVIENRPALSRWHPDYADAFAAFMARPFATAADAYTCSRRSARSPTRRAMTKVATSTAAVAANSTPASTACRVSNGSTALERQKRRDTGHASSATTAR